MMKNMKLKARRIELGITQKEMADRIGITVTTYNFKENGKREFKAGEIAIVANILQCKYSDIFVPEVSLKQETK